MPRPELALARKLRRSISYPEVLLWQRLRGKASGYKFRKQHPIGPYVVDFYCLATRLIVEVDGAFHGVDAMMIQDRSRDDFLYENGFRVLRVTAGDIARDIDAVLTAIVAHAEGPLHRPSDGPRPRSGEDR